MVTSINCPSGMKCKRTEDRNPLEEQLSYSSVFLCFKLLPDDKMLQFLKGEEEEEQCDLCGSLEVHGLSFKEHRNLCSPYYKPTFKCLLCTLICKSLNELEALQKNCRAPNVRLSNDYYKMLPLYDPTVLVPAAMPNYTKSSDSYLRAETIETAERKTWAQTWKTFQL